MTVHLCQNKFTPSYSEKTMNYSPLKIELPSWISPDFFIGKKFISEEDRMDVAIALAKANVEYKSGGPFGAAVFNASTGELIAPGVNLVIGSNNAVLHAEIVAIMIAQSICKTHDLSSSGKSFQLVSSTEPCAMCLGAVVWSGVKSLVCGARETDARSVGFDEGPKPYAWWQELDARGINVIRDINRVKAAGVLKEYATAGGPIYNAKREKS